LLLQILPFFKQENVFALKGGSASIFFYRNLPRLSVDIDLKYLPINKREIALTDISKRIENVSGRIIKQFPKCEIVKKRLFGFYFDESGLVYWTMGAPIEETIIINRCPKESTYEYRLKQGTLPGKK